MSIIRYQSPELSIGLSFDRWAKLDEMNSLFELPAMGHFTRAQDHRVLTGPNIPESAKAAGRKPTAFLRSDYNRSENYMREKFPFFSGAYSS